MKEQFQKKQFEFFIESNLDLLCVTDPKGKAVQVNKEFENVLGYKVEELNISLMHKDDIVATMAAINEINEKKTRVTFVNRYLCKNGGYRNIEWHAILDGKYIYASGRDITEKIEKEDELKNINSQLVKLTEELKRKNEVLESIANTDKLTSVYNRHFFDQMVENKIKHADIHNETMSLIIFDVDNFKQINDTLGHPVGDEVLKITALIAKNAIRKNDILFRWGGEEFIILMPKTNLSDAILIAERIRKKIEENIYEKVEHLTCSFGVAERLKNKSFKKWYQKVDDALYRAKSNGRNCVCSTYNQEYKSILNANFQWQIDWESGDEIIDKQHHEILEIANGLINMSLSKCESQKLIDKLDMFLKHIEKHFAYEEEVLNKIGYSHINEHSELHKKLIEQIINLKKCSKNGRMEELDLFKLMINDVAIGHIIEQDTLFFPYIKNEV